MPAALEPPAEAQAGLEPRPDPAPRPGAAPSGPAPDLALAPAASPVTSPAPAPDPIAALAARPSPFPLALPIDCRPGEDCWVINHVDLDPGPGRRDYRCGAMSYDGHKGTDFALRNLARLADDVAVLAAADGRVVGARDGMADVSIATTGRESCPNKPFHP